MKESKADPDPVAGAEAALRHGDLLATYDLCTSAIMAGNESSRLRYLQILALARMGNTDYAIELYEHSGLETCGDVDCMALAGRLLKDLALKAPPGERGPMFRQASQKYEAVANLSGSYFPLINAASLAKLAHDDDRASRLAERVLAMPTIIARGDYFSAATSAEAHLLLSDVAAVIADVAQAAKLAIDDDGARSSTLRQLNFLCDALAICRTDRSAIVAPLRVAPTMMFAGHMFKADAAAEAVLRASIHDRLEQHGVRVGYGALACGADILIAEALLDRGGELNIVLPFAVDDFERYSVLPGGETWGPRFRACLRAAHSIDLLSTAGFLGDARQFSYGSSVSMGLARLRAGHLGGDVLQLAIWDGVPASSGAGTAHDVARAKQLGWRVEAIDLPAVDRALASPSSPPRSPYRREMRAIIFSDFAGYSSLKESELPFFWTSVMGSLGAVLARYRDVVLVANSWGDALFAVVEDVPTAAEIVLALQAAIAAVDLSSITTRNGAGMRFGVHYGPVFLADDPITGRANVFGSDVTLAARIEPITPKGDVYVTQTFAAMLALEDSERFSVRYVGTTSLAKSYGSVKMFSLGCKAS